MTGDAHSIDIKPAAGAPAATASGGAAAAAVGSAAKPAAGGAKKPEGGASGTTSAKLEVGKDGKKVLVYADPADAVVNTESRGYPFLVAGDKKLNACCGADPPGARDSYEKAATQFKADEEWEEACQAYIKAAEVCETITDREGLEAGRFYEAAAKCMRQVSPRESLKICEYALKVYEERVSTGSTAKVLETMGEVYEKDLKEYGHAMDSYERAADNLIAQDSYAKANQQLIKVATLAASRYDFKRAIAIYERVAKKCMDPSSKYISEGFTLIRHLYHAGLCQLVMCARAGDIAPAAQALAGYRSMGTFERSDEYTFLSGLVRAFEENNAQLFTDTCYKYDKTHPLDQWSSTLLLECKQILKGVKSASIDVDFPDDSPAAQPNMQ